MDIERRTQDGVCRTAVLSKELETFLVRKSCADFAEVVRNVDTLSQARCEKACRKDFLSLDMGIAVEC